MLLILGRLALLLTTQLVKFKIIIELAVKLTNHHFFAICCLVVGHFFEYGFIVLSKVFDFLFVLDGGLTQLSQQRGILHAVIVIQEPIDFQVYGCYQVLEQIQ